ncbi:reverse transcriptase, partial [Fusarium mundagurra]
MRNRLVLRLRQQGLPDHLARWAGSFMDGRSARVRYQDTVMPSAPLMCGLPQGSPVSPILFLLYTEPIYRLSDTVEETSIMASSSIDEMVRWGAANGVSFVPKKTEVMHFSRRKLRTTPAVRHGDVEKHPETALRWLGIWLDSRLSFRIHVEKWAAKAKAVAYHLRGLTNTIHGSLLSARMSKAMNQAMRAVLPVWKTTPATILHRESGIPQIDQLLDARRLRFSTRLKSLDEAHPLASRTRPPCQPAYHDLIKRRYQAQTEGSFRTRLRRTDELLTPCARPKLVQRRFHQELLPPLQMAPKDKSADAFSHWVESLDPLTLVV